MKLTLDQLSARCPNYREVKALNLDCQGLATAAEVDKCPLLEFASMRFNSLLDISAFARCKHLWVLDLQQNRLTSLEPLASLPALGSLILSSNPLTLEKLQPLRGVHILSLEVSGLQPHQVAEALPSRKQVYYALSKKAQEVVDITNIVDIAEREVTKFQYLLQDLDTSCELQDQMAICGLDLSKGRGLRFPHFRLTPWLSLPSTSKASLTVYINLYLEGLCGEQVFALVAGALVKDTDVSVKVMGELKPHYLLGLGLILAADCEGHTLGFAEKDVFTLVDLATDFSMAQARLIPQKQSKMVNRESSPEYSQSHSDRTKFLCQVGLKIAEQSNLNYLVDPKFQRGKHVQLKTLFSTMRLFAGEDQLVVASAQRISTRESTAPDRVYDHGRNSSVDRKPPVVKKMKGKGTVSNRQLETEAKGPIQVFSAEGGKTPQFMMCTDAQVQMQPKKDWRSMQMPPDMYVLQNSDSHISHIELSYQNPPVPEKDDIFSQISGSSTPIPPRMRDTSPPHEPENKKDGTFLTSIGLNGQKKPVQRSMSTSTLTSRPSVFVSPMGKWRPIASKVLCVVTDQPQVSSYNYYESHKDLLPALPVRKISRPKLSVIGRQAGARIKTSCSSAEEHLARVFNRDFTPWVPYQLYPKFRARKDQFCVNYGEILVWDKQNMHPRVAIPEEMEESSLVVDSHMRNTSLEVKPPLADN